LNEAAPINDLLKRNVDVVAHSYSAGALPQASRGYVEYGVTDEQYRVLTDIEGHVVMLVRHWSREALIPSSFSPLDLITIGRLVVLGLSALTTALVVRTFARRAAAKALSSAVKRELTSGIKQIEKKAEEEFEKDWSKSSRAIHRRCGSAGGVKREILSPALTWLRAKSFIA